jgi:hypothetical protein
MRCYCLFIFLTVSLLFFGCQGNKPKEYVFFQTEVLDTQEHCGGLTGGSCVLFATISYMGKNLDVDTRKSLRYGTENEGFEVEKGQVITIEGIYDYSDNSLHVLGVYNEPSISAPNKKYVYLNVSVSGVSEENCDNPSSYCEKEKPYSVSYTYNGKSYHYISQEYKVCGPDLRRDKYSESLDESERMLKEKFDKEDVESFVLKQNVTTEWIEELDEYGHPNRGYNLTVEEKDITYYKVPYWDRPLAGDTLLIEGLYDEDNNILMVYYIVYKNKIYRYPAGVLSESTSIDSNNIFFC